MNNSILRIVVLITMILQGVVCGLNLGFTTKILIIVPLITISVACALWVGYKNKDYKHITRIIISCILYTILLIFLLK